MNKPQNLRASAANNKKSNNLKPLSLARSLTLVMAITSAIALLQAYLAFVYYDQHSFYERYRQELTRLAEVTAANSIDGVIAEDASGIRRALALVKASPHIHYAAVLDAQLRPLAEFRQGSLSQTPQPRVIEGGLLEEDSLMELSRPIYKAPGIGGVVVAEADTVIGHVYIAADLEEGQARFFRFTWIGFSILVVALLASLLIARRLIPSISGPISRLVSLTETLSRDINAPATVSPTSIKELRTLNQGIVALMKEIQQREKDLRKSEQRLSLALKGSGEGMWDWNIPARSTYFDQSCCEVLGIREKEVEILDKVWNSRIHPDDVNMSKRAFIKTLKGQTRNCDLEYRVANKQNDGWAWVHLRGSVVDWDSFGRPLRMTGTMADVTDRKRIEDEVKLYAAVFDNTRDAVVILDGDFYVLAVNRAFTEISGYEAEEVVGTNHLFLQSEKNPVNFKRLLRKRIAEVGEWDGEAWDCRKNGEHYPQELALNGIADKHGQFVRYVGVFSDITERKKAEEELRYMANYDTLTELPNRGMFQGTLNRALQNAKRQRQKLALLFVDLDKFKSVNDNLGHDAGDELLRQVAKRLRETVRDADVVARLAGDEFTIILENINSDREAELVAKKTLQAFEKGFVVKGQDTGVGASIGIAFYPDDARETESLMQCADMAMYFAKSLGRNNLKFYSPDMNTAADERSRLEGELRQAFNRQELEVFYQPKVDAKTLAIVGFEALLRWRHDTLGWISPADFIAVAEDSGLIKPIGDWVLREACRQLKQLHAAGFGHIHMAINVSAKQFQLTDFPVEVATIFYEEVVDPRFIELELTESLIMEQPEKVILMLRVLKNLGVSLSVDDFGTGYSSLSYLRQFPIDTLKVDRSFVSEIGEREDGIAIAAAIISMAHNLNLNVVAEGVETEKQLQRLRQLNCEQVQGYLIGKPVPAHKLEILLAAEAAAHNSEEGWIA